MNKKLLILSVVMLLILSISAVGFAAPERYSTRILGLDVKDSNGNWYRMTSANNDADIVYLNGNSGVVQRWFNTRGLVAGNYTQIRLVISNSFTVRGHYHNGADEYYTKPGVPNKAIKLDGSSRTAFWNPDTHASDADVVATIPSDGSAASIINNAENAVQVVSGDINYRVFFNIDYPGGKSTKYADSDIIIRRMINFTLDPATPKDLVITWRIDDTLTASNFTATNCDVTFALPVVTMDLL